MGRKATGQVIVRPRDRGNVYALRFRAYGERRYVTLGSSQDGWNADKARTELENVLADVRRGIWRPPAPVAPVEVPAAEPSFHVFASEWLAAKAPELSPRTIEDYTWALSCHLLPFFAGHLLSQITIQEVDRYRVAKVRERDLALVERPLSNGSINKTLTRLAQVLDVAVEYGFMQANPARGRRRRLKPNQPRRRWVEPEQVRPLIDAAGKHRALVSTLMLAGLRVGELIALEWRDVDLAAGRLTIRAAKTPTGVRTVDLTPGLREELALHRAASLPADARALVFPTSTGRRRDRNGVLKQIVRPAVKRANAALEAQGASLIAEDLTTHALRHTFASLLFEAGASVPYVMSQLGHADPAVTLKIYAHVLERKTDTGAKLDALVGSQASSLAGAQVAASILESEDTYVANH